MPKPATPSSAPTPAAPVLTGLSQQNEVREYVAPQLVVYGSLRIVTEAVGNTGRMDGGSGMGTKKTGF